LTLWHEPAAKNLMQNGLTQPPSAGQTGDNGLFSGGDNEEPPFHSDDAEFVT
jgi:hypothetical protein